MPQKHGFSLCQNSCPVKSEPDNMYVGTRSVTEKVKEILYPVPRGGKSFLLFLLPLVFAAFLCEKSFIRTEYKFVPVICFSAKEERTFGLYTQANRCSGRNVIE